MASTGCERHKNLRTGGPVCLVCLMQQRDALRAALEQLMSCHTEAAGFAPEVLFDRSRFRAFLRRQDERLEAAKNAARAALSA